MSLSIGTEEPTREEELARLARSLRLARGFRLFFARSLPGAPRRALLEEILSRVEGVRVFEVSQGVDHLRSALEGWLADGPSPRAICVTGIEAWVPAGDAGAATAFVRNLNASRDLFAEVLPCPLVIWGADHILRAIQHGAPDFFSVASGIVLFPDDVSALRPEPEDEGSTLEGVAHWLRELEEVGERLRNLGPDVSGTAQVDRIAALNRRVVLLLDLARYAEAEREALSTHKEACRVIGSSHPATLASASNLALVYQVTGRYLEAERIYNDTLNFSRRELGLEHPTTLLTMGNLAALYQLTHRYEASEPLTLSVFETVRRNLGPDHPQTLSSANNLAYLYASTGRLSDAEPLYAEVYKGRSRVLGSDHPRTLESANNLAHVYWAMGRQAEAERLMVATLETRRHMFGPEHPATFQSVNNLANLYHTTGRKQEAFAMIESSLYAARRLPEGHEARKAIEDSYRSWSLEGTVTSLKTA